MRIEELAKALPQAFLLGDPDIEIQGISYDSRRVGPGDLFVCIKGYRHDGHSFIRDALLKGAVGLVVESDRVAELPPLVVPVISTPDTRKALPFISAHFYDYPSQELRLIGVTGTNGKTTTTYLVKSILTAAGHKVGLIGGIGIHIGDSVLPAERTTPESLDLQRLFRKMVDNGCDYAVMEVSSHAVGLNRIAATEFDIAIYTNLSQDHLDFHSSMEEYLETKTQFFAALGVESTKEGKAAILNLDDRQASYIARRVSVPIATYGTGSDADFRADNIEVCPGGLRYTLISDYGCHAVEMPITGHFNVYNSLAALAACAIAGVEMDEAVKGLSQAPSVPGRLEAVKRGQDFAVLVDYAHTPDGLENAINTIRGISEGRSIVVFGCGGDRDKSKRPLMGEIAGRLADIVIVTSDNPRSEDPDAICREIVEGVKRTIDHKPYQMIIDRRQAINRAVELARTGDTVLIAGKGHETYQILADQIIHFDDREEASRALEERLGCR